MRNDEESQEHFGSIPSGECSILSVDAAQPVCCARPAVAPRLLTGGLALCPGEQQSKYLPM